MEGYFDSLNLWYIIDKVPKSFENFWLLFSTAKDFDIIKKKMTSLIVDATGEEIFLQIICNDNYYTNQYLNSSENFDKISLIVFDFLKRNKFNLRDLSQIFVNQGPGKFSTIRSSIVVCKALCFSNNINLYGFNQNQISQKNYNNILDLLKKGVLIKDNIKPIY